MMIRLKTLFHWHLLCCSFLLGCCKFAVAIKVVLDDNDYYSYRIVDDSNQTRFQGGDLAVFVAGKWCTSSQQQTTNTWNMTMRHQKSMQGQDPALGRFDGIQLIWDCHIISTPNKKNKAIPIVFSFRNFPSAVVFDLQFPKGAPNTNMSDPETSMTNFPTFLLSSSNSTRNPQWSYLSWHGSFVQSVRGLSTGPLGGPTVFYDASDPELTEVIVGSPWNNNNNNNKNLFKSFTAGTNQDWRGRSAWAPGTSARITDIPSNFTQSFILYQAKHGGITSALHEWGKAMQSKKKRPDVTLQKIGYQTDNGAAYCFCRDSNCSNTLMEEVMDLDKSGVPMGYLSFQGAGTSSGRGQAAPWCVETWGVDGGLDKNHYPMPVKDFQKAMGIPLQLYCPYFCPTTTYFDQQWTALSSDPTLPRCSSYDFRTVVPEQSKEFYGWFLDKGINAGMTNFETDFMNQNFNCIPDFVQSATKGDVWLNGMAEAALERNITIQWCYATPSDVLASIDMPAVTQFRVSFDYCYGQSWNIGESSLLVWALGAAPSKDTLWTTDNGRLETPGCAWTPDKESEAAELHLVLALMSTGPVGISDAIGMTNATLARRAIRDDGVLLKPSKAITAVDSTFLESSGSGYLYSTFGLGPSWIFVSFQAKETVEVPLRDFWPRIQQAGGLLAFRHFDSSGSCSHDADAILSSCVGGLVSLDDVNLPHNVFSVHPPDLSLRRSAFSPSIVFAWRNCIKSRWFLLGELNKYVPLSPARFHSLTCTSSGVSAVVKGGVGEVVELTALKPHKSGPDYKVVFRNITIPNTGAIKVVFEGASIDEMENTEMK